MASSDQYHSAWRNGVSKVFIHLMYVNLSLFFPDFLSKQVCVLRYMLHYALQLVNFRRGYHV